MNSEIERNLIELIHSTPTKACIVVTGAGTSAISALFAVAGASRTVIDAQIPYSRASLDNYVGVQAEQHVSKDEAMLMAVCAYEQAVELTDSGDSTVRLVGLSCTAAIVTDRHRRGENRAHVSWHDGQRGATYSIVMKKGARDRAGEEAVCRTIILGALAEACRVDASLHPRLFEGESVERVAN